MALRMAVIASSHALSRHGRHDRFARGPLANATAGLPGGQGQRERALPVVDDGLGAGSNGVVGSASGAGAATTVGAGLGFFFFAACAGGGACSGEAASAPGSVGGLSSGFGAEASATGASWITTVPPLQAVSP